MGKIQNLDSTQIEEFPGGVEVATMLRSNGPFGSYRELVALSTTVTTTAAATATATALIPDGFTVLGVDTMVTGAITVASLTGYTVGDGSDADRWGAVTGHVAGTKTDALIYTAGDPIQYAADTNVVLTAVGANFPAGGTIRIVVFGWQGRGPQQF